MIVELKWQGKLRTDVNIEKKKLEFINYISEQSISQSSGPAPTNAVPGREFKERAGFNRRRGAMRRRVHQVIYNCWKEIQ